MLRMNMSGDDFLLFVLTHISLKWNFHNCNNCENLSAGKNIAHCTSNSVKNIKIVKISMNISISIIICSTLLLYKKSRYVSHKAGEDHSYCSVLG